MLLCKNYDWLRVRQAALTEHGKASASPSKGPFRFAKIALFTNRCGHTRAHTHTSIPTTMTTSAYFGAAATQPRTNKDSYLSRKGSPEYFKNRCAQLHALRDHFSSPKHESSNLWMVIGHSASGTAMNSKSLNNLPNVEVFATSKLLSSHLSDMMPFRTQPWLLRAKNNHSGHASMIQVSLRPWAKQNDVHTCTCQTHMCRLSKRAHRLYRLIRAFAALSQSLQDAQKSCRVTSVMLPLSANCVVRC